jgi:hypothetical protein
MGPMPGYAAGMPPMYYPPEYGMPGGQRQGAIAFSAVLSGGSWQHVAAEECCAVHALCPHLQIVMSVFSAPVASMQLLWLRLPQLQCFGAAAAAAAAVLLACRHDAGA